MEKNILLISSYYRDGEIKENLGFVYGEEKTKEVIKKLNSLRGADGQLPHLNA